MNNFLSLVEELALYALCTLGVGWGRPVAGLLPQDWRSQVLQDRSLGIG